MALLYSITLFISAALLFIVQPMIGKMILPLLGGTPAVWNTCMLFFQTVLLSGYAYAHFSTRWLGVGRHAMLHLGLLVVSLFFLPIRMSDVAIASLPGSGNPVPWLLGFLAISASLPLFLISATAPLLQKWFALGKHRHAHDPYFLYASSNAGSMLGLLSYPSLIEPNLRLVEQSGLWAAVYGFLLVFIAVCAFIMWQSIRGATGSNDGLVNGRFYASEHTDRTSDMQSSESNQQQDFTRERLWWVLLAFIPSSLMLGVTTYLTTDVAPFPLLWVIPLALYLLTFILVFSRRPVLPPHWLGRVLCMCTAVLVIAFIVWANHPAWLMTSLNLAMFVSAAMICHGELAKGRPTASRLTEFYLCMSIGGVLGGLFNALIAPLIFKNVLEYPLVMVLACAIRPVQSGSASTGLRQKGLLRDIFWPIGIGLLTAISILAVQSSRIDPGRISTLVIFGVPALLTYRQVKNPIRFSLGLVAILAASLLYVGGHGRPLLTERNFFGMLRVTVDNEGRFHQLFHGNTLHGRQSLDPENRTEPLSYFHRTGPFGQVMEIFASSSAPPAIAVIGLGAGSLATYATPSQGWTFYEIDPAVIQIARNKNYFTFLENNHARSMDIIVGDARLRLKDARDHCYGLIVLDAFSSDSIPAHLVTREALHLYLKKLADNGVMAFHITNRRLDLEPIFANLAYEAGLVGLSRNDSDLSDADIIEGKEQSLWVVMARSKEILASLVTDPRWQTLRPSSRVGVWTDDFSNILSVLSWKR